MQGPFVRRFSFLPWRRRIDVPAAPLSPAGPVSRGPRLLVIVMRRLGDVLVATPLMRSLLVGLPGARIDVLVLDGSQGIIQANPDIQAVIKGPLRPSFAETLRVVAHLWGG